MEYNAQISSDELKHEFDKLKNVFVATDAEAKFHAAAQKSARAKNKQLPFPLPHN